MYTSVTIVLRLSLLEQQELLLLLLGLELFYLLFVPHPVLLLELRVVVLHNEGLILGLLLRTLLLQFLFLWGLLLIASVHLM